MDALKWDTNRKKIKKVKGIIKEVHVIVPRYVGKPKGLKQLLFERRLWKNGMNQADM